MIISVLVLAALIAWHGNSPSGKALMFGGVYAVVLLVLGLLGLMAGGSLSALLVVTVLRFAAASFLFWLLDRFHGMVGWLIAILGSVVLAAVL